MKKKLVASLLLGLVLSNVFSVTSYAIPNKDINLQGLSNEEKIQVLDNEISTSIAKTKEFEKNIEKTEKEIEKMNEDLVDIQKEYQHEKNLLKYKNGNIRSSVNALNKNTELNLLEVIFKSENLSELFRSIYLSQQIAKQNNKSLQLLELKESQVAEMKKNLIKKQDNLVKDKEELLKEKELLEKKKILVEEEIANTPAPININTEINTENLNINISNTTSKKVQDLLKEAFKYLGTPYVWGGTTPNGFDCSGFTQYVYRTAGVNIPRVSQSQQLFGTQIPISQLQPGDMVFWGYPAHHVGIYIGDGKYIHSPRTGDVIKISNIANRPITSATRVL